jgi:Dolichyl-phosphate-mannose-protein mannosyltransferase
MEHLTVCRGVPYASPAGTPIPKITAAFDRLKITSPAQRPIYLAAIFIALLHAWMAITAANTKSPTFDEPQHLTAGYSYWVTNDFRLDPENGNLPAMWAAVPLLFDNLKFIPLNDRGWQRAEEGRTAHQFFYEVGNDPDLMLRQARMMMSIFGAALCLLIFCCAREFFGGLGGLLAEIVVAFDPNFLAHSPLVTSDVPAAFFFTATVWSCWQLFQRMAPATWLIAALSLSGLFLTKFSAPVALPVLGAMSMLQIFSRREIGLQFGRFRTVLTEKRSKASVMAVSWLVLGATLFFAIWGSCSFRYAAWTDNKANHQGTVWHWDYLLEDHGTVENAITFARDYHLLPETYLYGFAYVHKHEIDRPAFLDNQWSIVGFRSFFPRAFLYKTPVPLLCLLALAIYAGIANRRSWKIENAFNPLWGFALLYGAFAITAQLNIGHRHILPIYPALIVGCGAVVLLLRQRRQLIFAAAIALLVLWQMVESFAIRPNYLAYFNEGAGGPSRGYKHLADSSVDWGQDLPALKTWLDEHGAIIDTKPVYLAYFGTADPRFYGIDAKSLVEDRLSSQHSVEGLTGGVYCISATTLQSLYARELGPWCLDYEQQYRSTLRELRRYRTPGAAPSTNVALIANNTVVPPEKTIKEFERLRLERLCAYLRHHDPIAQIGYSIFVFDLKNDEIKRALYGPPAELSRAVQVRGL